MSVTHPLAIVSTSSITSLVRMTLYHHSISIYHAKVETNAGLAALAEKARSPAEEDPVIQRAGNIPG